jgi:hypothetical protein
MSVPTAALASPKKSSLFIIEAQEQTHFVVHANFLNNISEKKIKPTSF